MFFREIADAVDQLSNNSDPNEHSKAEASSCIPLADEFNYYFDIDEFDHLQFDAVEDVANFGVFDDQKFRLSEWNGRIFWKCEAWESKFKDLEAD